MIGECPICHGEFQKISKSDRYCSPLCREKKKNLASNANWAVRKPRVTDPKKNYYIRWAANRKDPCWLNRFSACRG